MYVIMQSIKCILTEDLVPFTVVPITIYNFLIIEIIRLNMTKKP